MDQKKLIEWKENPTLIGKQEVEDLERMLQDFPYFSLGQILLAKGYKNISHYKQEEQTKKASLYCSDREWLYHFLRQDYVPIAPTSKKTVDLELEKEVETKPTPIEPKKPVEVDKPIVTLEEKKAPKTTPREKPFVLNKSSAWKEEPKRENPTLAPEKTKIKEDQVVKKVKPTVKKEENKATDLKPKNKKAKTNKEEDTPVAPPKKRGRPPKAKEEKTVKEKPVEENTEEKPKVGSKKAKKSKIKKRKKKKKVILDEKDLLDELMRQNISYNLEDYFPDDDSAPVELVKPEKEIEEVDKPEEPQDFFSWLKSTEQQESKKQKVEAKPKEKSEKKVKAHKSLTPIEEFLKNKTSAPKKKASFFSPIEMAKKSDNIEGEIVSETLAKVYESQERFNEAILTYEKLILLFPQKETYFATRIKDLRKQIDNK